MLESMHAIEEEVEKLRSLKSAYEHDLELAAASQRQSSGGVWRLFSG